MERQRGSDRNPHERVIDNRSALGSSVARSFAFRPSALRPPVAAPPGSATPVSGWLSPIDLVLIGDGAKGGRALSTSSRRFFSSSASSPTSVGTAAKLAADTDAFQAGYPARRRRRGAAKPGRRPVGRRMIRTPRGVVAGAR